MALNKFPILYSRNKNGSVQTWQIIVDGNSYHTISGQMGGAITSTKPTVVEGKTRTTGEEQAILDAESIFKKKKKSKGYFENIEDIDTQTFIEPMLAEKLAKRIKNIDWTRGVIVQLKYNGKRIVAERRGLFSRTGELQVSTPHIWNAVKHLFEKYPNLVIDGEGYNYSLRTKLNELMSILNRTKNITADDIVRSEQMVKFYVYDGYGFDNITQDAPYIVRIKALHKILEGIKYIEPVPGQHVFNQTEMYKIYQEYLDDQQEGIIVRIPDSPYVNGRCKWLLKEKPTDDFEYKVIDIEEGDGDRTGVAGRVILEMEDGKRFNAAIKGTFSDAGELLRNKDKFIGNMVKIFFNGKTGLGTPNYAQFNCNDYSPVK